MGSAREVSTEAVRLIVADTGPLLHLGEIGALKLLHSVGEIHVPDSVEEEIALLNKDWLSTRPPWVAVTPLDPSRAAESRAWQQAGLLDRGEADAIGLARQLPASWLLTDDASARLMAEALGIETHGSLGVVLWASSSRKPSSSPLPAVSPPICDGARNVAGQVSKGPRRFRWRGSCGLSLRDVKTILLRCCKIHRGCLLPPRLRA